MDETTELLYLASSEGEILQLLPPEVDEAPESMAGTDDDEDEA